MDEYVKKAKELGYEVEPAFEVQLKDGSTTTAYSVKGLGLETYYDSRNEDEWKFLTNPEAHEHREKMFRHNDPEVDFQMTEDEQFESSMKASVSVGTFTEEQAKELREQRKVLSEKPQ
jgi:hypothetical protein